MTHTLDRPAVAHRRARLRELIDHRFDGRQVALVDHVAAMAEKHLNQGLLSSLVKNNSAKAFGEKLAASLAVDCGLPANWFDLPMGTLLDVRFGAEYAEPQPIPGDPHIRQIMALLADADPTVRAQALGAVIAVVARATGDPNLQSAPGERFPSPGSCAGGVVLGWWA